MDIVLRQRLYVFEKLFGWFEVFIYENVLYDRSEINIAQIVEVVWFQGDKIKYKKMVW